MVVLDPTPPLGKWSLFHCTFHPTPQILLNAQIRRQAKKETGRYWSDDCLLVFALVPRRSPGSSLLWNLEA